MSVSDRTNPSTRASEADLDALKATLEAEIAGGGGGGGALATDALAAFVADDTVRITAGPDSVMVGRGGQVNITGGDGTSDVGGSINITGGAGPAGQPGGSVFLVAGTGDDGALNVGAQLSVECEHLDGTPGYVYIYTGGSAGDIGQVLAATPDGSGYAVWTPFSDMLPFWPAGYVDASSGTVGELVEALVTSGLMVSGASTGDPPPDTTPPAVKAASRLWAYSNLR